jgi:prepilin-type processing-associated H-X9-DG protein
MPKVYQIPGDDKTPADHTRYQVFVGNGAAFDKTQALHFMDFTDGLSNTILVIEAEKPVPWTKPEDIPYDPSKPIAPLLSSFFRGGCNVLMADGSVRTLPPNTPENTLHALITRNRGEVVNLP